MNHSTHWGRWGPKDERGMANLLDAAAVLDAVGLVRSGRVYTLAMPMEPSSSSPLVTEKLRLDRTVMDHRTASERQVAVDSLSGPVHNFTHVDALSHVGCGGRFFNGFTSDEVLSESAVTLGVDRIGALVARAVVLDVAAARSRAALAAGDVVTVEDLERAREAAGIEMRSGGVVLLRTGWLAAYRADPSIVSAGWPGLGAETVDWLVEHQVVAAAADTPAVEVAPFEDETKSFIVHERYLRDLGGYLVEFADLDGLVADCVREGLFVMAPLRLVGGTGSPVTPVLIT